MRPKSRKNALFWSLLRPADGDDTEQSLDELEELGQTAGAVTVAKDNTE